MHVAEIYLPEMVVDFVRSKFGETFVSDDITIKHGLEALALAQKVRDILDIQHIKVASRNHISKKSKKIYQILSPYRHLTGYQNRMLSHIFSMYFRQEFAWYLVLSDHVYRRDKIRDFIREYGLENEDDQRNLEKLIERKKSRQCLPTSMEIS